MLTPDEKMETIQVAIGQIEAVNHVLTDAIWYAEVSGEGDYVILLEQQKEFIRSITNLF